MDELIKELTLLAKEVRSYYQGLNDGMEMTKQMMLPLKMMKAPEGKVEESKIIGDEEIKAIKAHADVAVPIPAPETTPVPAPAPEVKKRKAKKEEAPKPETPAPKVEEGVEEKVEAPKPPMTEKESLDKVLSLAKQFVQRHQKSSPDGVVRARKMLTDEFKARKIGDLTHDQRVAFITMLEVELSGVGQ